MQIRSCFRIMCASRVVYVIEAAQVIENMSLVILMVKYLICTPLGYLLQFVKSMPFDYHNNYHGTAAVCH